MNCVIYGTKCQYTPPWSPNSGRKKDTVTKSGGVKKRSTGRNSTSPVGLDGQNSPASSFNDDSFLTDQNMLPKMANARRLAAGMICAAPTLVSHTQSNTFLVKNMPKPQNRPQILTKWIVDLSSMLLFSPASVRTGTALLRSYQTKLGYHHKL